jgi:hypothetical protein
MQIEMTGIEDRQGPWKIAVCGFAGSGKTMFGSTARNPLFVFFGENPRLKSVATRGIPHVKLSNEIGLDGTLSASVQDQLHALVMHLQLQEHDYDTLVIDTGDELFHQMKAARTIKNGGEFKVGDWGWIGDTYREVILGLIDLPMNVIVNYHVKTSGDEEGGVYRELALQGAAKDEAPGWFDIVGVMDTYVVTDDDGADVTKRALVVQSSRLYPWVKDHSAALGARFEISSDFVGDFPRLLELVSAEEGGISHEVLEEVGQEEAPTPEIRQGIPTPEDLQEKKKDVVPEAQDVLPETEPIPPQEQEAAGAPEETSVSVQSSDTPGLIEEDGASSDSDDSVAEEQEPEPEQGEVSVEEAVENVEEVLDGEQVEAYACAHEGCDQIVEDTDLRELSQIRFRKNLCRQHFSEAIRARKGN